MHCNSRAYPPRSLVIQRTVKMSDKIFWHCQPLGQLSPAGGRLVSNKINSLYYKNKEIEDVTSLMVYNQFYIDSQIVPAFAN